MTETVAQLVQRTLRGEAMAFAALIERYQGMICGLALNSVGCFAEAEDIAQDALVEAYRNLPRLRDPKRFPAWLRSIAMNKIRSHLRKRRVRRELATDFQGPHELPSRETAPVGADSDESLAQGVLNAMQSLPGQQRQTIAMYYLDGRSYGDIADFMSVPVSTVKSRMHAGRRRLREEMMPMVEHVLDSRRPGAESAARILRRTVRAAATARRGRDYRQVLDLCDRALAALGDLRSSAAHARTRQQVLVWRGESAEYLLANPPEALRCFRQALEVARAIDDASGQARAIRAILLTSARAGDFATVRRDAETYLAIARANRDGALAAFCAGARELADDPTRKDDPGGAGGFTLSHFRLLRQGAYWTLTLPIQSWRGSEKGNVYVNRHCGTPAFPVLLCHLYGPQRFLPLRPKVGMRWRGSFTGGSLHLDRHDVRLSAESVIETDRDIADTPAGRFRNCLRVKTVIRAVRIPRDRAEEADLAVSQATQVRWLWFAPGVGLVRIARGAGAVDAVLVDCHVTSGEGFLPLSDGDWWRYHCLDDFPLNCLTTETWRVVHPAKESAVIACASHSHEIDKDSARQYRLGTEEFLRRSSDPKLRLTARLRKAGGSIARLQGILRDARRIGDRWCEKSALERLFLKYDKLGQTEKADLAQRKAFEAAGRAGGKQAQASFARFLINLMLRGDRIPEALASARQAEDLFRESGYRRQQAGAAGVVDVLTCLAEGDEDKRARLCLSGWMELRAGPKAFVRESSSSAWYEVNLSKRAIAAANCCLGMCDFLRLPVRLGKTWTQSWNGGWSTSCALPSVTRRVESRNDSVETSAGDFRRCLCIREEIRTTHGAGGLKLEAAGQGYHDGVRTCWYAPAVGLVKVDFRHRNGKRTIIELTEYHVRRAAGIFPTAVGDHWRYRWLDEDGKPFLQEFWRITSRRGQTRYLGFAAFGAGTKSGSGSEHES